MTNSAPRAASAALVCDLAAAYVAPVACRRPIEVEAGYGMAGLHKVRRHRQTHVAQADESDRCHD